MEIRVAADELSLEFEHNHGDGALGRFDGGLVGIDMRGESRERAQADAVAALEHIGVVVAQGVAYDRRDADLTAQRRAHPEYIVIAPLDIDVRVMLYEQVEDSIGPVAAVEKVAHDVQVVYGQPLDEHGKGHDEVGAAVNLHDGVEQALVIEELRVVGLGPRVHELDDNRGVAAWDETAGYLKLMSFESSSMRESC